jgi:hypothetical protein
VQNESGCETITESRTSGDGERIGMKRKRELWVKRMAAEGKHDQSRRPVVVKERKTESI